MIDLSYKNYTDKDYLIDEVSRFVKTDRNQLKKLNKNTLLDILVEFQNKQGKEGIK